MPPSSHLVLAWSCPNKHVYTAFKFRMLPLYRAISVSGAVNRKMQTGNHQQVTEAAEEADRQRWLRAEPWPGRPDSFRSACRASARSVCGNEEHNPWPQVHGQKLSTEQSWVRQEGQRRCGNRSRGQRDVALSQGMQAASGPGEAEAWFLLRASGRIAACSLIGDPCPPEL